MVKPRQRSMPPTAQEIENFGNQAEQPPNSALPVLQATKEPKVSGINLRMTRTQHGLLQRAALDQDISQQKVLERLIWPVLNERYGE